MLDVVVHPGNDQIAYAISQDRVRKRTATGWGDSATGINPGHELASIAIAPLNDQILFIGANQDGILLSNYGCLRNGRLYRSTNAGASWADITL